MTSFVIADGPTTTAAERGTDATVNYSFTNSSSGSADARLSVLPSGASNSDWFSVDGNRERTFAEGESQTATIRIKFPADAPGGEYPFRLRVVAVNDPDNDHAEGPVTVATLGPLPAPKPS